jgi:signal transduction histidine kinase
MEARADTDFLLYLSHELRTALNAMLGHAQLLRLTGDLEGDAANSVDQILAAGWHVTGLLDEVHDVATVEAGATDVASERVELEPLLNELAQLVQPLARERSIELTVRTLPAGAAALCDRRRLAQVTLNLLTNAIKYSDEGDRVEIRCMLRAPRVQIAISDTGPGISPDRIGALFEPFERLGAERGSVGGSGIGLALSRRLVELMNGTLDIDSRPGRGSCFTVELPLAGLSHGRRLSAVAA